MTACLAVLSVLVALACSGEPGAGPGGSGPGGQGGVGGTIIEPGGGGAGGSPVDPCGNDGDDCFEGATPLDTDRAIAGSIHPPDTDVDLYRFEGEAGQRLRVVVDAKPDEAPFHPSHVDLVATLHDGAHEPIASNDDARLPLGITQDPELVTVLPETGTYFIAVHHFCQLPDAGCSSSQGQEPERDYAITLEWLDDVATDVILETEPNDDPPTADTFATTTTATSNITGLALAEHAAGDLDVFTAQIPPLPSPTAVMAIGFVPGGPTGSGSTAPPTSAWLVDPATDSVLARLDDVTANRNGANATAILLAPPVLPDTDYLLYVESPAGALGQAPHYAFVGGSWFGGEPEQDDLGNDQGTEPLAPLPEEFAPSGGHGWIVNGTLGVVGDVDRYLITLPSPPPATPTYTVVCWGERWGSGVRGLQAVLRRASDETVVAATPVEAPDQLAAQINEPLPPSLDDVVLEVGASGQAANNPSTFYICQLSLYPFY